MAVGNLKAPELSSVGLTYVLKSTLGTFLGDTLLVCVAIAIFVCCLANQTGAVRMIFAMARDNGFPGSHRLARISERDKTPVVPVISVAVIAIVILLINIRQPQLVVVVTSDTVILALIAYVLVVGPFALLRMRGKWARPEKGYFSLGRAGLAVSITAFIWGVAMIINIAWPRRSIYNPVAPFHWWLQWGGVLFPAACLAIAFLVYWFVQRHKIGVLAEHAAVSPPADTETETVGAA
jgi:amino acid transporter